MSAIPANIIELYRAGHLEETIRELNAALKHHPTDLDMRFFLFCLHCFKEDYEKAERQLEVFSLQRSTASLEAQLYRGILDAERKRRAVFHAGEQPGFLSETPPYAAAFLEALRRQYAQKTEKNSPDLRETGVWRPTERRVTIDGETFESFSESHDLLAPFLEVFMHDRYLWLPFEQLKSMHIDPPEKIQDLLWIKGRFEFNDGQAWGGLIPTRYLDSGRREDERLKLGRLTEWEDCGNGQLTAFGQRMFAVAEDVKALLEIREITFES